MFSKKIAIFTLACLFVTSTGISFAANKINNIETIKLPKEITLQNASQKALFMGSNQSDIKQNLLDRGFLGADVYQIQYKNEETYKYGVVADIRFGVNGLNSLGINAAMPSALNKKTKNASLGELANLINTSSSNQTMPYQVVSPLTVQKNGTYVGEFMATNVVASVPYSELFHVVLYDSPYYGTAARVVAINNYDNSVLWPLLEPLNKI